MILDGGQLANEVDPTGAGMEVAGGADSHNQTMGDKFTLDRDAFAVALRNQDAAVDPDDLCLDDFGESLSRAIGRLVDLAHDGKAIAQPEDLAPLSFEIVVYSYDGENEDSVMIALRPGGFFSGVFPAGVPLALGCGQITTFLADATDYGSRNASGVDALATTVENVLTDASGLLPLIRVIVAGSAQDGRPITGAREPIVVGFGDDGAPSTEAWRDIVAAADALAATLRKCQWQAATRDVAAGTSRSGGDFT